MDLTERKNVGTKSDDDLGEYERVGVLVARKNDLPPVRERKSNGRGAVFYCPVGKTLPKATPWYLPATEPEFASVGTEIQQAVTVYRPSSEGVMVIVTRHDGSLRRGSGCQPTIPPLEPG